MSNELQVWESRLTTIKQGIGRKAALLKWGAGLIVLALLAPALWAGVVGLVGAVVFGAIALAIVHAAPVYAQRLANWQAEQQMAEVNRHIAAIKAEASRNPVETLQQEARNRESQLKEATSKVAAFGGKVNSVDAMINDLEKKYPEEAKQLRESHQKMVSLYTARKAKLRKFSEELEELRRQIDKAGAIWEVVKASRDLHASAGLAEQDFMSQLKTKTSFEAVRDGLAETSAELDMLMEERVEVPQLGNSPSPTLDEVNDEAFMLKEKVQR